MKRIFLLLLFVLVFGSSVVAQTAAKVSQKTEFFPLDQVKPGMRAIGYTVFVGTEPKKFELEILGVLKGFPNPKQSAVLSKLLGEELEHTGVFGGMSGSPVYIDGKLLGAVAFGYQFAKDPIAGITPIQQMVDLFENREAGDQKDQKQAPQPRSFSFSEIALNQNSSEFAEMVRGFGNPTGAQAVASPTAGQVLMPISTPLAITGVAPEVLARFAGVFQSLGFLPVAGVSGAAEMNAVLRKPDAGMLKPGSTIAVALVRGDYSLAAAGTVTYRDGDKVYAFGHPFLSVGVSDFPMHEGEVVTVMSSQANSFKLSFPTDMVGSMRGDRSTGIYGEIGQAPNMIPMEINMKTSLGEKKTYRFEIVSDRFLSPILTQMMLISSITSTERAIGDSTIQVSSSIKLKDQPAINLESRFSVSINGPIAAGLSASLPISVLFNSGFKDIKFEKIVYDITSRDARSTGQLDRIWVDRTEVRRGDKIEVQAFARTDGGGEYVERIPIEIPLDAPLGKLQIIVGDGNSMQSSDPRSGFTAKSVDQLVRELNKIRKSDRLYVRLARSESGALIKNEEMPSLPPSVLATLGSDRTVGGYTLMRSAVILEKELSPADFVISGQRTITIEVVNQ